MKTTLYREKAEERLAVANKKQADLATHFGITTAAVSDWFCKGVIPMKRAVSMAKYLNCHPSEFCDYPKNESTQAMSREVSMDKSESIKDQTIVSVVGDLDNQVVSIKLTANQRSLLKVFEKIPEEDKDDAVAMFRHYSRMDAQRRSDMLVCAIQNKTCKSSDENPTEAEEPLKKVS
ncbi:MAG: helix-turn-helix transcriptional regulator [Smithella sp.]